MYELGLLLLGIVIGIILSSGGNNNSSGNRGVVHCKQPTYPRPEKPSRK